MSKNCGSCQGNPNSKNKCGVPKFKTFLNQVLYSLLMLENTRQGCGATIKDISKYMRENFQVCGDLTSQVETSMNEAITCGYVYENDSKFFTVGAIAKIQLCKNPQRKKEMALESMQVFIHKPQMPNKCPTRKNKKCNKPKPCNAESNLNKDIFNQSTDFIEEMMSQLASVLEERKSKENSKEKQEMKTCLAQETCAAMDVCEKIECPEEKKDCEDQQRCKAKKKCETIMRTRAKKKCESKRPQETPVSKSSCSKPTKSCSIPVNKKASVSNSKKCKSNLEIAKVNNCKVPDKKKKCPKKQTFSSDFGLAKMPQKDNGDAKTVVYVPTSTTGSSCETPKKSILRKRRFVKKKPRCQKKRKLDSGNYSESDSVDDNANESSSDNSCQGSCCKPRSRNRVRFSKECIPKRTHRTRKRKKCDCK